MWRIGLLLERGDPEALHRVDEALALAAHAAVDLEDALEGRRDLALGDARADDLPERGEAVDRAAEGDLVPLLAVLIDTEDPDVADVVMPAGIHAAGHLQLDLAQVVEVVEVVEPLLDLARDVERAGVR